MKFPEQHCIETKHLSFEMYCTLITKLVTEGYKTMSMFDHSQTFSMWKFIGVDEYGYITLLDMPWGFMQVNAWMNYRDVKDEDYPNVLNQDWLNTYIGEVK